MPYSLTDQSLMEFRRGRWETMFATIYGALRDRTDYSVSSRHSHTALRIVETQDRGRQSVPIYRIVAGTSRFADFDSVLGEGESHVSGRGTGGGSRLVNELQPIELARVADTYVVIDGNRRVIAARDRGQLFMPARVTEYVVNARPAHTNDVLALSYAAERDAFYSKTHLQKHRPDCEIASSRLGNLTELARHIDTYCRDLEIDRGRRLDHGEGVARWYDMVYPLVVGLSRRQSLPQHFPQYTEADIYLWAMEHRWQARIQREPELYTQRFRARLKHGLRDILALGQALQR